VNTRVVCGILAIVGAGLVALGCYLPYAGSGKSAFHIFQTKSPHAILWFAAEPAAVVIASVALGIMLLLQPHRWMTGALLAMGGQTALMFAGYIGYNMHSGFSSKTDAGGWIGIGGAAAISISGLLYLLLSTARTTATQQAGWYPDPDDATKLRYWSGNTWTEHRHDRVSTQEGT
jgi:Protein of unknown function (DUF2510)